MAFTSHTGHDTSAGGGNPAGQIEFVRGDNGQWTALSHHHTKRTDDHPLCLKGDGTLTCMVISNEEFDASGTVEFWLNGVLHSTVFAATGATEQCVIVDTISIPYVEGDKLGLFFRNDSTTANDFKEGVISIQ